MGFVMVFRICFLTTFFYLSNCDRQVTFTCDGDDAPATKGDSGAPGKRGPRGPIGNPGPKGNAADVRALETLVETMNQAVMRLQHRITLLPDIQHFHFPSAQVTWSGSKRYCEGLEMLLCSRRELFPRDGVMRSIGYQPGDHWTPVRDRNNGWVQVGDGHRLSSPGTFLRETHGGSAASWGETRDLTRTYKGHVFCCLA